MKKQILFVHGGTAFTKYEDFLAHLQTKSIEDPLETKPQKRWQSSLREQLIDTHEVYYPAMPNKQNAKYTEWKMWFERYVQFLRDDAILVGHSLGGYFLVKYLSENQISIKIRALFILAAPFENGDFKGEDGGDFAFDPQNLPKVSAQIGELHIFHSEDDPVVPFAHAEKYKIAFPNAHLHTFEDKNHFILEEFPELVSAIQVL